MKDSDFQRIEHIKKYCEEIAGFIVRFGEDYAIFSTDNAYLNAVSMSIMQIGELSIGLSDNFKESTRTQMQWGLIRGMRNMFAHTYAKMDKVVIWDVATKDIPVLLRFCESIVEKAKQKSNRIASPKSCDDAR